MKNTHFYHFDSDPRFPPFLLYVRWKYGVTFVWRCFRDDPAEVVKHQKFVLTNRVMQLHLTTSVKCAVMKIQQEKISFFVSNAVTIVVRWSRMALKCILISIVS